MAVADLYVTKEASPDPVGVGQPLTYTITVGNLGPDAATSVGLTDSIPAGVLYQASQLRLGASVIMKPVI